MINFDANLIVVFLLVWILVIILTKVYFKPMMKTLDARRSKIRQNQKAGEKARQEYEKALQEIEESLKEARKFSLNIQEEFRKEALLEKEKMIRQISTECRTHIDEAKDKLDAQVESIKKEIDSMRELFGELIEEKILH